MAPPAHRSLVLLVFFISGASGLIYEVIWLRLTTNVLGSGISAVSAVLVAFMSGLAIGGATIGWLVDRTRDALRFYALLEFSIGSYALTLPGLLRFADGFSLTLASTGGNDGTLVSRFLLALAVLLPPTILMGGTLPALSSCSGASGRRGLTSAGSTG